ncbi:DNA methyltransferase [Paracoccus sp. AK26]|uniref:Eco57I restriction-modification methylase domain-containing protein n=1 Tax=Paracoccus sp. AK26 TaxID=2589076 RepID=UPI0014285E0D|nr:DNA methyltransferase [Paracoccus sp. AK26]QIR85451.1 restriction endonuclease subunit M [Paracoccus sp. AK26]
MELYNSFISRTFLRSVLDHEYQAFKDSPEETTLVERLNRWAARADLGETSAEAAFFEEFFRQTWGYIQAGQAGGESAFSLLPRFSLAGGAARGGVGIADAALGYFPAIRKVHIPQVLCEFKGIRDKGLDTPQKRKGDNRSPVQQGLGYLAAARRGMVGTEPIVPAWAIITDMNEFRLYWADRGERQSIRFVIRPRDLFQSGGLLGGGEEKRFERFLFRALFHRDMLTVQADTGRPRLLSLIQRQRFQQRELENTYYAEYRAFRERLYRTLLQLNGEDTDRFPGTRGRLVRLAQKILDRCLFIFFCDDMGAVLGFPPQLLRDFLTQKSSDPYFDRNGDEVWTQLRRLFAAMNDGTAFGGHNINRFNGGLFAPDPALDRLHLPNFIFCEQGQDQNDASLHQHKETLLYLCAAYNYAAGRPSAAPEGAGGAREARGLGLYTLGRIFEQSITELEILEADADERPSLNRESRRKRDGVYYTPEWVVERIVAETIGERLAELKIECGWPAPGTADLPGEAAVEAYEAALRALKIVDPACGSGAFLITSLRYLLDEWKALGDLRRTLFNDPMVREENAMIADILRRNIYGVDINAASVEIAKLALWLHTASANQPLSSLDEHVVEGNSLIGPAFYEGLAPYNNDELERINAFDWQAAFPEVFERGGFDAVVGNPPYVKLQNFRRVHADMADFLARRVGAGGQYHSTQTGNFDLYLPFIEKGINLLNDRGRLGYIAPSVWIMNEYGEALREHIAAGQNLYGWIDFGSFQIFDEATTYTALQFFSKSPSNAVRVATAPDGYIPEEPWAGPSAALPYARLPYADRWLLLTGPERDLIDRLARTCIPLGDRRMTRAVFVGIQTSADPIYHLTRRGPGRYECAPRGNNAQSFEVRIEDAIMKPLVSGEEAKRYLDPLTDTYLLFPYDLSRNGSALIPADVMARDFPQAWAYLRRWETELRARENNKMDNDANWWAYNYPKNLNKQETPKLMVAQLVPSLRVSADPDGAFYINNVRVNGIAAAQGVSLWYLLGVLNGPVADFVFRRIAKPKDNRFFEANRQFIAPLPIPDAAPEAQADIATGAEELQRLHSARRDTLVDLGRRFQSVNARARPDDWLFSDLPSLADLRARAPAHLDGAAKRAWARAQRQAELTARHDQLDRELRPGVIMDATFSRGELRFLIDGMPVIEQVFAGDEEGAFVLTQWKVIASTFSVPNTSPGKRLADRLRRVAPNAPEPLRGQVMGLQVELADVEARIRDAEAEMNRRLYSLYDLSPAEITMVEQG